MNSCLYECRVTHARLKPKKHLVNHKNFMFYLDLDEVDGLARRLKLFARNRFNLFGFTDADHLPLGEKTLKENLIKFVRAKGFNGRIERIMLLTNLRTLGYIFNPVSFYFCFDERQQPVCAVAEVCNTFREIKPYFLGPEHFDGKEFRDQQIKYFYVSPFVDLDVRMDFRLPVPGERLAVHVDDIQGGEKFLYASLTGERRGLTDRQLLWYSLRYPWVTFQVIFLIHTHAGILHFIKKVLYHPKEENPHLQKEVLRAWRKN